MDEDREAFANLGLRIFGTCALFAATMAIASLGLWASGWSP